MPSSVPVVNLAAMDDGIPRAAAWERLAEASEAMQDIEGAITAYEQVRVRVRSSEFGVRRSEVGVRSSVGAQSLAGSLVRECLCRYRVCGGEECEGVLGVGVGVVDEGGVRRCTSSVVVM